MASGPGSTPLTRVRGRLLSVWRLRTRAQRKAYRSWKQAQTRYAEHENRDRGSEAMWLDLSEASIRADGERLGDIGDAVIAGTPVELFNLTENERLVVDAYIEARLSRG